MNDIEFEVLAKFQEKQIEAWNYILDPRYKYILYGGAAGGGKSYLLRWAAVGLAMYFYGKYNILQIPIGLFSEDYPTLRDRQITKILREFPAWLGELKDTNKYGLAYHLAPKYGSGIIMLRNLDDPSKYASVEFASILVEELTKNPEDKFEDLRTRMRFPGIEDRKFIGATNPGEIGHGWVKRKWVKVDDDHPDLEQAKYIFIPSKYSDNAYNPTDYGIQLSAIKDPQKRAALLDGSWDVFSGQYFEEWREDLHIIDPIFPPSGSLLVGGMDWGRSSRPSHKTAFYFSVDKVEKLFWEDDNTHDRYGFYRCKTVLEVTGKDKTPEEWSDEIELALRGIYLSLSAVEWVRADPAMFHKKDDGSVSIAEQFMQKNEVWRGKLLMANNDRIAGWEALHKWLSIAPDGLPYWQISRSCKNLIRTLPELIHDENKPEDVDTEGEDHPGDGERYKHIHLKWIDGFAGRILTDRPKMPTPKGLQMVRDSRGNLVLNADGNPMQQAPNLDAWATAPKGPTNTNVVSSE